MTRRVRCAASAAAIARGGSSPNACLELGAPKVRRSDRLAAAQTDIGMVLGGEPDARLSRRLAMPVSGDTVLRGIVERHQSEIRDVACRAVHDPAGSPDLAETMPTPHVNSRRRDRCEAALCLHREGLPTREIARRIGASRNAVRRWVRAGQFVPSRRAPGASRLDRHPPFVEARWQEGQHDATVLHRELRAQGFSGSYDIVRRWAARRRTGAPARPPCARIPLTRRITRWFTADPPALSWVDHAFTEALGMAAPKLRQAAEDIRAYADRLHQNDPTGLTPWWEAAATTDLGGFVAGLRQDEAAVRAASVEPWSNGPVEGQVNRLKPIKRSMYGRAKFEIPRQCVLHAAYAETSRAWPDDSPSTPKGG